MQDTTTPKPEALSRTWKVTMHHRCYGENWGDTTYTVTLSRDFVGGPLTAEVDGEAADLERAVKLVHYADAREVLAEVLAAEPTPTIGKARACKLHRILGRFGLPSAYHYQSASEALGRKVESLAALTESEARRVWFYLVGLFPGIRQAAA